MNQPKLAFFRGSGIWSHLVRWQTDGPYGHVATILSDGTVIEAMGHKGVIHKKDLAEVSDYLSKADIYSVPLLNEVELITHESFLLAQVGTGYDYWGNIRFISRRKLPENNKWFCSELAFQAFVEAGHRHLARTDSWQVSPSLYNKSPLLALIKEVKGEEAMKKSFASTSDYPSAML